MVVHDAVSLTPHTFRSFGFVVSIPTAHTTCCVASGSLRFGYGCAGGVGVDVGGGGVEVDVIYITFIMSAQYIGYLVPYKDKV